jgi:excisionase family DNA binding protein
MADKATDWLTIPKAAALLDISERTIYRRIKSGELKTKQKDGRTVIRIDKSQTESATDADKLTIARLEALLEDTRNERDYLRQALAAALSKIPTIEAHASEPSAEPEPRRRWWPWRK